MISLLLTIVSVYIAMGIFVIATLNFGFIKAEFQLENTRQWIPLVCFWPVAVFVIVAMYNDLKR